MKAAIAASAGIPTACSFPGSGAGASRICPKPGESILVVSQFDEDHQDLQQFLNASGFPTRHVPSRCRAIIHLIRHPVPVVICEERLPGGGWTGMLAGVSSLPHPPLVIVASRLADERLWAEVLNTGGYDLLIKPFEKQEVLWVVMIAWQQRQEQLTPPGLERRRPDRPAVSPARPRCGSVARSAWPAA